MQAMGEHHNGRRRVAIAVSAALVLGGAPTAAVVLTASPARAAAFVVTSTADLPDADLTDGVCAAAGGACTLRAAVQQTDALPGMDSVTVSAGTYLLDSVLQVEDSLFITAPGGAGATVLDGQSHNSVLKVRTAEMLVCDSARNSVVSFDRNGQRNSTFVSPGAGGLSLPGAVTSGSDGDVYVTAFSTGSSATTGAPACRRASSSPTGPVGSLVRPTQSSTATTCMSPTMRRAGSFASTA